MVSDGLLVVVGVISMATWFRRGLGIQLQSHSVSTKSSICCFGDGQTERQKRSITAEDAVEGGSEGMACDE